MSTSQVPFSKRVAPNQGLGRSPVSAFEMEMPVLKFLSCHCLDTCYVTARTTCVETLHRGAQGNMLCTKTKAREMPRE